MHHTTTKTTEQKPALAGSLVDEKSNRRGTRAASLVGGEVGEEKCPVIRASQILFTGGTGRTRVVFF